MTLRACALLDLKGRPAGSLNGSKPIWAVALAVVSSAGILPVAYLRWGRRQATG